jgi:GrpB-like predicted nucleotidyltransferase (UPF0157 family)
VPFPDESRTAAVVSYREQWPREYEELAGRLRAALGESALAIDHVGSTSVPLLAAKDCIDVQVQVREQEPREAHYSPLLAGLGFRCRPEPWNRAEASSGRRCAKLVFAPPPGARVCNVHLRPTGAANARYALLFRDYLRADSAARSAWGAFKVRLAHSVPDLGAYGQIKAPATEVLMGAAERWAVATGWDVA